MDHWDITIDYMDMHDDRRVWALLSDVRSGLVPIVGTHVVVGCEDARPSVAQILSVNIEGHIELRVLPGTVEANRHLLSSTLA
jgi:hypothetical protein